MFAVLTTGGKQYRVEAGTELLIERVDGDAGSSITFDRVLLVSDGDECHGRHADGGWRDGDRHRDR